MEHEDEGTLTEEQKAQRKAAREGYVPLERLNEATGKLRDENSRLRESFAALEARVQTMSETQQPPGASQQTPKEYSRAELKGFIEAGQISQNQADELWDAQQEAKFERKLKAEVEALKAEAQHNTSLTDLKGIIRSYVEVKPEMVEEGSEDRDNLRKEFNRLARVTGVPKAGSRQDYELQVIALENVYGSVENARKRKQSQSQALDENLMVDQPNQGGEAATIPESKALKALNGRQKQHYQRLINRGIYKDWKAVESELTWKDKQK